MYKNGHSADSMTQAELHNAFECFNRLSASLISSYDQLNATVKHLDADARHSLRPSTDPEPTSTMSEQSRALIDAIPGAVVVLNAAGRVEDVNVAATELLGEPLLGEAWRDIVARVFFSELDQGELRSHDGRQFSISTRPLGYQPGQILLLSDVTQTRSLQRAAQQNLHLMTMGKMMASLAHQIRTPLSSSMLYLSQVADAELDADKTRKFTGKALERIRHIEKTINDMLVFAHGGEFHMHDFALDSLLTELHDHLGPQVERRGAELEIPEVAREIFINGNRDALLGALTNLCMNAMDAGGEGTRIEIDSSLNQRGNLQIEVLDNAGGMDERTLQHLFDPFYTTKSDGTGLGLAVVKSVIESHQGEIRVTSEQERGSRFTIELPCQQGGRTQLSQTQREVSD